MAVAIVGGCGLALIPLAISQNGTGHDSWIAAAPLGLRLRQIVPQFLIGTGAPARTVLRDVAIALVALALARLLIAGSDERDGALVAGGLALAGFVLSLVLVAVGFDDLITRNIIALWLPAALVVAGGLAHGRAGAHGRLRPRPSGPGGGARHPHPALPHAAAALAVSAAPARARAARRARRTSSTSSR